MNARPPRIARALIRVLTPRADRPFVLADLDETFDRLARERGAGPARGWYRRQAAMSVVPLVASRVGDLVGGLRAGDVRFALRQMRRRPQYAVGVSGTLALGLASAFVLGGLAWSVWLRPLPLPDSERLVRVWERGPADPVGERVRYPVSPPLLERLRDRSWTHLTGFAGILGSTPEWIVEGEIRQLRGATVSPGFFDLLGIAPLHGRVGFSGRTGSEVPEVVLAEPFWRRAFGGDPAVVGTSIDLGGVPHRVIGVVAAFDGYPEPVDLVTPLVFETRQLGEGMRGARYIEVVARVRPSSTLEAAAREFAGHLEGLGVDWASHADWTGEVVSLRADLVGPFRDVLRLLLLAGLAFFCLALVNVVGLAAARSLERRSETAVRRALGASEARLGRGALVEGAVLGAVGGVGAAIAAGVLLRASVGWLPEDLPRAGAVAMGPGQTGAGLLVAVVFGAVLVAAAGRWAPAGSLRHAGRRTTPPLTGGRALVIGQFALTTLLLGAGALALERSLDLADRDLGFDADGVWTGLVVLPRTTTSGLEARRDAWGAVLGALHDRGFEAALSTNPPMSRSNSNYTFRRPGDDDETFAQYAIVSPDYFDVMGVPVLEGRGFEPGESGPVVVISKALADEHFPGEDPVGLPLSILLEEHEIVGVAGSTAHFGPDTPEPPMMYVPYEAVNWEYAHLLVAGGGDAVGGITAALADAVPGAAPPAVVPYERNLSRWFRPLRIQVGIVGALAVVGGLLAALGLYSTLAFQVRGRLAELGIRSALGATRTSIVAQVVRRGVAWAAVGLAAGLALWWVTRGPVGRAMGVGDAGFSSFSLLCTAASVMALALVALAGPARRAARADPLTCFRT